MSSIDWGTHLQERTVRALSRRRMGDREALLRRFRGGRWRERRGGAGLRSALRPMCVR